MIMILIKYLHSIHSIKNHSQAFYKHTHNIFPWARIITDSVTTLAWFASNIYCHVALKNIWLQSSTYCGFRHNISTPYC